MTGQYDRQDQAAKLTAANEARIAADPFATIPAAEADPDMPPGTCPNCGSTNLAGTGCLSCGHQLSTAELYVALGARPAGLWLATDAEGRPVCGAAVDDDGGALGPGLICARTPHGDDHPHIGARAVRSFATNPAPSYLGMLAAQYNAEVILMRAADPAAELSAAVDGDPWRPEADPAADQAPAVCGADTIGGPCQRAPHPAAYPHIGQAKYAAQADADMPNAAPAAVDLYRADWPYPVLAAAEFAAIYTAAAGHIKARGYNAEEVRGFDGEPGISITGALRLSALDYVTAADPTGSADQHIRTAHDLTEELETRLSAVLYVVGQVHTRTGIRDLSDVHVGWSLGHYELGPTPGLAAAVSLLEQAARMFAGLEHVTEAPAPDRM